MFLLISMKYCVVIQVMKHAFQLFFLIQFLKVGIRSKRYITNTTRMKSQVKELKKNCFFTQSGN